MSSRVYEIQGYAIALPHVLFVSSVFIADQQEEGWQFNIRLSSGQRLPFKFPNRPDAAVARELFIKALNEFSG